MDKLHLRVPEEWERWAERSYRWRSDPERPQQLSDGIPLRVGRWPRFWLPSGHILLPPISGGARLFNDAASQYLENTTAPVTAYPLSMAAWGRSDNAAATQYAVDIGDSAGTDHVGINWRGADAGDPISAFVNGSGSDAVTSTGYSVNVWAHGCGVFASATSRAAYINGGSKGTNTTSETITSLDRIGIGRTEHSSPGSYFSGDLAEVAVWNIALSDADVLMLSLGVSPLLVRPDGLVFYVPLIGRYSPEIEVVGGLNMTVTGATQSEHPRVFYPGRVQIVKAISSAPGAGFPTEMMRRRYQRSQTQFDIVAPPSELVTY